MHDICLSRKKYEFADDISLFVGAKVLIVGHEEEFLLGHEYIPSMHGMIGYIAEIWSDEKRNIDYRVIVPVWNSRKKIKVFSDEIYSLSCDEIVRKIKEHYIDNTLPF